METGQTTTAAETTTTTAATQAEATTTTQAATTPPMITMTPEEYNRMRESELKLAKIELEAKQKVEEKERERLVALSEQGQAKQALTELETRYKSETTDLRDKFHRTLLTNDIARSTLNVGWVSDEAAKQANALLATEFEVIEANGSTSVRHKATGKPAAEVIPNLIASSAYAHFQKPTTTGGTGQAAADKTASEQTTVSQPRNLGEFLIEQARATKADAPVQAGINRLIRPMSARN